MIELPLGDSLFACVHLVPASVCCGKAASLNAAVVRQQRVHSFAPTSFAILGVAQRKSRQKS